ncbi:hypothetical protein ACIPJS_05940 [Streptomyces sp. NPDC086783]|uniref:hypothetical protein n=1 Tax=Streptomyces sp. NPDC086783 TaxID=3365758 RepID=UPI00380FF509
MEHAGLEDREFTSRIQCADWFDVRERALLAHATQIDPDGPWFLVSLDAQRGIWTTEECEPARSLVDTSLPEDDMFAGAMADITHIWRHGEPDDGLYPILHTAPRSCRYR